MPTLSALIERAPRRQRRRPHRPGAPAGVAGDAAGRATPSRCPRSASPPTPAARSRPSTCCPAPRAASARRLLRRRLHRQLGARLLRPQPARERVGGGAGRRVAGRRARGADDRRRRGRAQLPRAARPAAAPRGGAATRSSTSASTLRLTARPPRRRARHAARRRARADPARQHRGDPAGAAGRRSTAAPIASPRSTAEPPRDVAARLAAPRLLPTLPVTDLSALPLGTPEQLLRRRPDLVQSERQLAAATADIGVATADLFPRVSLTGLIGFASNQLELVRPAAARSSTRSAPA